MKHKSITRRDFLKGSTSAAVAGALYLGRGGPLLAQNKQETRVVLIRDNDVLGPLNKPDDRVLQRMLDDAVTTLLDEETPVKAWRRLIKPADIVGIKTNVWNRLPVPKGLEQALKRGVMAAGVKERNISILDRGILRDSVFKKSTALINTRPMRTHYWSGVGTLLKNYITFVPKPSDYHGDTCADLASIWKLPHVQGKTRLNILVMLTPLFNGSGPHHYNPRYTWAYKGLLVGTDPVAVDATGLRILLAKRKAFFGEERPFNPPPKHILLADTRHHLGTADPAKIDLVRLGWEEDSLI